jgi:hypothetical protein
MIKDGFRPWIFHSYGDKHRAGYDERFGKKDLRFLQA